MTNGTTSAPETARGAAPTKSKLTHYYYVQMVRALHAQGLPAFFLCGQLYPESDPINNYTERAYIGGIMVDAQRQDCPDCVRQAEAHAREWADE